MSVDMRIKMKPNKRPKKKKKYEPKAEKGYTFGSRYTVI